MSNSGSAAQNAEHGCHREETEHVVRVGGTTSRGASLEERVEPQLSRGYCTPLSQQRAGCGNSPLGSGRKITAQDSTVSTEGRSDGMSTPEGNEIKCARDFGYMHAARAMRDTTSTHRRIASPWLARSLRARRPAFAWTHHQPHLPPIEQMFDLWT